MGQSECPLGRRGVLRGVAGFAAGGVAIAAFPHAAIAQGRALRMPPGADEWETFKRRFISADGRVVDAWNGGCSHTEGQGLGMLFAVSFDDPDTFELVRDWTARHLRRPCDALHAWRYQPSAPVPVSDWNNATDGDLFIAAALHRASLRWGRPDHGLAAAAIARDILRLLVRDVGGRTVLLPGAQGFEFADSVTLNPSYYVFPILAELAACAPSPLWERLRADGASLIDEGRFGPWQLPPDWLLVARRGGRLSPHPHWPARFSYDAIRIPLYTVWGRIGCDDAIASFCAWVGSRPTQSAWVDLVTDASAPYGASPGMVAIAQLANKAQHGDLNGRPAAAFPSIRTSPDYYSGALMLLTRLAWQESQVA